MPKENLNIQEARKIYLERFNKSDNKNVIYTREPSLAVSFSKLTISDNSKEKLNMPELQNVDDIKKQLTTLYHELQKAKSEIENFKGKSVVLFYGKTGTGKSTLLEYLKLPKETIVYKYCLDAYKIIIKEDFEGIAENSKTEEIYLRKTGNSLKAKLNSIKKGERGNVTIPIDYTTIEQDQDLDEEFLSSNKNEILNQLLNKGYIANKPAVTYKNGYPEDHRFIGVGTSSETSMPRFERVELKELEIKSEVKKKLTSTELYFCDLPGLSDNRGPVCDIITAYCIKQLICEADGVKFVVVERSADLDLANKDDYFSQIDHLLEMLPQENVSVLAKSVSIIGTQGDLSAKDLYSSMQEKSLNNPLKEKVKNCKKIQDLIEYIEDSLTVMKSPYAAFQQEKENFSLYEFWEDKKGFVSNGEEYIGKSGFLLNLDIKPYLPKIVEPDRVVIPMTKNAKVLMDQFVEIIDKRMEKTFQEIFIKYLSKLMIQIIKIKIF